MLCLCTCSTPIPPSSYGPFKVNKKKKNKRGKKNPNKTKKLKQIKHKSKGQQRNSNPHKKALAHTQKKSSAPPPLKPSTEQQQQNNPEIHTQANPYAFLFHRGAARINIFSNEPDAHLCFVEIAIKY